MPYDLNAQRGAKPLIVSEGGIDYFVVTTTAASPTNFVATRICRLYNSGGAQTNATNVYDCVNPLSPQASELVWSEILGANEVRDLQLPIRRNLCVEMAGTLTASSTVLATFA
jgi:hypothetical protein